MRKVLFILGQLSDADVEWLANAGQRVDVAANSCVIAQGKPVSELFIVLEGSLSISMTGTGEIARIGSGEIVGEMSFIDQRPPSASAITLTPCRLLSLSRTALDSKLAADALFASRFYKAIATFLADRLRGTVTRMGFDKAGALEDDEMQGELDFEVLDKLHLAGARFDRLLKRLNGIASM